MSLERAMVLALRLSIVATAMAATVGAIEGGMWPGLLNVAVCVVLAWDRVSLLQKAQHGR